MLKCWRKLRRGSVVSANLSRSCVRDREAEEMVEVLGGESCDRIPLSVERRVFERCARVARIHPTVDVHIGRRGRRCEAKLQREDFLRLPSGSLGSYPPLP